MTNESSFAPSRRAVMGAAAAVGAVVAGGSNAAQNDAALGASPPASLEGKSSFGKFKGDPALRAAWKLFCRRLDDAGEQAFKAYNPANSLQRADAFRFLMQNLGQAWALGYETKDTKYPVIHMWVSPFMKLGGDNGDCIYQQAWVDGESVYRISGNVGSVSVLNITVQGPRPEKQPGTDWPSLPDPMGDVPETNIFGHQMNKDWNGDFELYIGGPKREPNWVPTTPGTRKLFIRQIFDTWDEQPAVFQIERVGMNSPRPAPTAEDIIAGIDWAGHFIDEQMRGWPEGPYLYTAAHYDRWRNRFPSVLGTDQEKDKNRGRFIHNMSWELGPDEAMIIEFEDKGGLWMFTNMGEFFNSMDFIYRPVTYTRSRTKVDRDGRVRMVMCADDPGYHNWIDTQAFFRGNLTYRNFLRTDVPEISTKLVKRSQIGANLPPDSAKVTPEERVQQMIERFKGIRKRFGLAV
jgi:hypothetical protein